MGILRVSAVIRSLCRQASFPEVYGATSFLSQQVPVVQVVASRAAMRPDLARPRPQTVAPHHVLRQRTLLIRMKHAPLILTAFSSAALLFGPAHGWAADPAAKPPAPAAVVA